MITLKLLVEIMLSKTIKKMILNHLLFVGLKQDHREYGVNVVEYPMGILHVSVNLYNCEKSQKDI